jgi:hypothetical protein
MNALAAGRAAALAQYSTEAQSQRPDHPPNIIVQRNRPIRCSRAFPAAGAQLW